MNYTLLKDEEIISYVRNDQADAMEYLLKKYFPLVKKSIRTLYLIGADTEDLLQEGMIGLYKAIQSYQNNNQASFYTFAKLCIDRQIYSAIKASNRKKHIPLNSYISFYSKINKEEIELIDNLEAGIDSNPEQIILDRETTLNIENVLDSQLSKLEKEVLSLYLNGKSYTDIAAQLGKNPKSIDNAIQRIRDKVKRLYNK